MEKHLETRIELDLNDGFSEETLDKLKKGVIVKQNGNRFLIDGYNNGTGYLFKRNFDDSTSWVEFEIHDSDEKEYKLIQTEVYPLNNEEDIKKLMEAGI